MNWQPIDDIEWSEIAFAAAAFFLVVGVLGSGCSCGVSIVSQPTTINAGSEPAEGE